MKESRHIIRGMQKDMSVSKFSPDFAYDCHNIRISPGETNSLLSVTNEKGTEEIEMRFKDNRTEDLSGLVVLGYADINRYLVIFGKISDTDIIVRFEYMTDTDDSVYFETTVLYKGNIGFSIDYPIETLAFYENENIQKVYWVDGLNSPRVINIMKDYSQNNPSQFNFVQKLALEEEFSVKRDISGSGKFHSGIIQYAFSYYNRYESESKIVDVSPLNYISFNDRGGSSEDIINCSFEITINNTDANFEYIRLYSIQRTSLDATPEVKVIADLKREDNIVYRDSNNSGYTIDVSTLLYIGGEDIVASTLAQKDNTLFLGNIKLKSIKFSEEIKSSIREACQVFVEYRNIEYVSPKGLYPYRNQMSEVPVAMFNDREHYCIGIQFQTDTGEFTEPVFLEVRSPNLPCEVQSSLGIVRVPEFRISINGEINNILKDFNIRKSRAVVSFPESSERSFICEGVLCPTVFNLQDRCNNAPYSVSSWFMRPYCMYSGSNAPEYRHFYPLYDSVTKGGEIQYMSKPKFPYIDTLDINSDYVVIFGRDIEYEYPIKFEATYKDSRNDKIIYSYKAPSNTIGYEVIMRNFEKYISNIRSYAPTYEEWLEAAKEKREITVTIKTEDNTKLLKLNTIAEEGPNYYVDASVLTLHSPDIEKEYNNINNRKLNVILTGIAKITSNTTSYDIQASSPLKNSKALGKLEYNFNKENLDELATGLVNAPLWEDSGKSTSYITSFATYPWHRAGSLNDDDNTSGNTQSSILNKKVFANLRFSYSTSYFSGSSELETTPIQIFNSDSMELIKITDVKGRDKDTITYYGNVDTLKMYSNSKFPSGYPVYSLGDLTEKSFEDRLELPYEESGKGNEVIPIRYKSTPHAVFALNPKRDSECNMLPVIESDKHNYSELKKYLDNPGAGLVWENTSLEPYDVIVGWYAKNSDINKTNPKEGAGYYYAEDTPAIQKAEQIEGEWVFTSKVNVKKGDKFLRKDTSSWYQATGDTSEYLEPYLGKDIPVSTIADSMFPFLYVADILDYNASINVEPSALKERLWVPAGPKSDLTGCVANQGDTYFQRWDCLKTYAYSKEDINQIVDITSFLCKSRINLDGRYDRNRGQLDNNSMSPENFNLMNDVYSQTDNLFNYRYLDDTFLLDRFPNSIMWSKEKKNASVIDDWTGIRMLSSLDLDGDKGEITSLNTFNNELFCFQKKGLSNILFNSRVQIPTSDGTPIEITNGLKVQGKRYISNTIGCSNKWSITESSSGIYFIDNTTNSLYLYNGSINSLSDRLGFRKWISDNNSNELWKPVEYMNFRSFYDRNNNDVYFVNNETALCYSEYLGQFVSFFDYEKLPLMVNMENSIFTFKDGKLWRMFTGNYNSFFGKKKPFWITIIDNADYGTDKIYTNMEYRLDVYNSNDPRENFNTVQVWNEYQDTGEVPLSYTRAYPSNLKTKFRIWDIQIPRDKVNRLDRIRSPWVYLKLKNSGLTDSMFELHDINVKYFI